ncbi:MAG: HEPN domain-containing protein [Candidatus Bathyarchaeia archaeon]
MKTTNMAKDYAERAQWSLKEAEDALRNGKNAICVRRSQEALELSAKAVLRRLAIEYPREHDVSEAMNTAAPKLPPYLANHVEELKTMLTELARVRGPAFYGYETEGIPASQAFTPEYSSKTLEKTRLLVELCTRFATEPNKADLAGSGSSSFRLI